jgi:hypothetical protein
MSCEHVISSLVYFLGGHFTNLIFFLKSIITLEIFTCQSLDFFTLSYLFVWSIVLFPPSFSPIPIPLLLLVLLWSVLWGFISSLPQLVWD